MKIITISREFGSGGRELGKRLADALHIPCYDHEIIEMVAQKSGLDKDYVAHVSEKDIRVFYPATIAHRLIAPHPVMQRAKAGEILTEREFLRKMKQIDKERRLPGAVYGVGLGQKGSLSEAAHQKCGAGVMHSCAGKSRAKSPEPAVLTAQSEPPNGSARFFGAS